LGVIFDESNRGLVFWFDRLAVAIVTLCTWGTENMAEMASIFAERNTLP
jgi:hypothetical protein